MSQHLNTVRQIAYVVEDMEKALKFWTEYLKAGPFFTLEHAPMENQKYRGGPSNADVSIALGNSGTYRLNSSTAKTMRLLSTKNSLMLVEPAFTTLE